MAWLPSQPENLTIEARRLDHRGWARPQRRGRPSQTLRHASNAAQPTEQPFSWYAIGMEPSQTLWQVGSTLGREGPKQMTLLPGGRAVSTLLTSVHSGGETSTAASELYEQIHFIPAVPKGVIGMNKLIAQGAVHPFSALTMGMNLRKFGISGRGRQDSFTVACAFSHRRVWESMLHAKHHFAIIFEDDAWLSLNRSQSRAPSTKPTAFNSLTGHGRAAVKAALNTVARLDPDWEYINLGRCYDYCAAEKVISKVEETGQLVVTSPSSLCTHAYAVSAIGARKLLSVTLPHVFAVDVLVTLLSRNGLLRQYSLSPPSFTQNKIAPATIALSATTGIDPSAHFRARALSSSASSTSARAARAATRYHKRSTALPECGSYESGPLSKLLRNITAALPFEEVALRAIGGHKLVGYSPVATECPETLRYPDARVSRHIGPWESKEMCTLEHLQCRMVSSTTPADETQSSSPSDLDQLHPDVAPLLRQMNELGLDGAIIWGLRDLGVRMRDAHAIVHKGVYRAFEYVFRTSATPRHLCWIGDADFPPGCSLGHLLSRRTKSSTTLESRLGRSLVFASPKHMGFTSDPALDHMPIDPQSAYIFHEVMPPRFAPLLPFGRVVEWIVSGPDGNRPYLDSTNFVARSSALVADCGFWPPCMRDGTVLRPATFVAGWGTTLSPAHIMAARRRSRKGWMLSRQPRPVYFVGSIHPGNCHAFSLFANGCRAAGIQVVRTGSQLIVRNSQICMNRTRPVPIFVDNWMPYLGEQARRDLMVDSIFTPALQHNEQLRPDAPLLSFVPDRALDSAALAQVIATNNPAVAWLFQRAGGADAVAYSTDLGTMCRDGVRVAASASLGAKRSLQELVWRNHTYVTRLNALLPLVKPVTPAQLATFHQWDFSSTSSVSGGGKTAVGRPPTHIANAPWCRALASLLARD